MEKDAQDFYTYYMDKAQSESTRELFRELADIEKGHYEMLKKKHAEYAFNEPPLSISWVVDEKFAARDPHILSSSADLLGTRDDGASDLTIIRMAYLIENDFAEFYKHAIGLVDDKEARDFLSTLAQWENHHRDMFHSSYSNLLKKHWDDLSSIIFAGK